MSEQNRASLGATVVTVVQVTGDVIVLIVQVLYAIVLSLLNLVIPKEPKSVRGEIVLITGAGHGMGKELALLYAREGATVVGWDINEEAVSLTVAEINQRGYPKAHFFECDVSNRKNVLEVAEEVRNKVGDVTILINNAGIMPTHSLLDHTKDEIERIMNVNVMAHFWTLEAFFPTMKENNYGHVVCLSSCAGLFGIPNLVPYCATKYAVRGLMESLYQECRLDKKNEIRFTTIYPYMVDTGLCKRPVIKYENVMKMVPAKEAAEAIMDAQRREIKDATIPGYFLTLNKLMYLFPLKAQAYFADFVGAGLESDLD